MSTHPREQPEPSRTGSRQQKKAATRLALRDAAKKCFAEHGYLATQISDICKTAGVAQGTFYIHFQNKDEVLDELLTEFNREFVQRLAAIWDAAQAAGLESLVRGVARLFLDYWSQNKDFVEAYAQKTAFGTDFEALRSGVNPPMVEFLNDVLRTASSSVNVDIPQIGLLTHGLLAMWLRVGLQAMFNPDCPRPQAEDLLVWMTLGVLRGAIPGIDDYLPSR